jgi:hypothetical protein
MKARGTIEFQVAPGKPFYLRSTLGDDSQILLRGTLKEVERFVFEVQYYCQISELGTEPAPRLTCAGKAKISVNSKPEMVAKPSAPEKETSLGLTLSIHPLSPIFGARDDSSRWSVRLVDSDGKPVANAKGGLYGPLSGGGGDDSVVEAQSNQDGIIEFSEGRESLSWLRFCAEEPSRNLYASANLNVDKVRSKNFKYFTITMTKEPVAAE